MKRHFINFFQSFYSIKPYDRALLRQASARYNALVLLIVSSVVIAMLALGVGLYARFYVAKPIMDAFPQIEIVNNLAERENVEPLVLEGRPSAINKYIVATEEGSEDGAQTIKVLIDTQKEASRPETYNKPEYYQYMVIVARDGIVTNRLIGTDNTKQSFYSYRDLPMKGYLNKLFIDVYFWVYLVIMISFLPPFMASVLMLTMMIIGWRVLLCSIAASAVIHYIVHKARPHAYRLAGKSAITRSVLRYAFFLYSPSGLYLMILNSFVYCPVWLYYIIVTIGMAILLLQHARRKALPGPDTIES